MLSAKSVRFRSHLWIAAAVAVNLVGMSFAHGQSSSAPAANTGNARQGTFRVDEAVTESGTTSGAPEKSTQGRGLGRLFQRRPQRVAAAEKRETTSSDQQGVLSFVKRSRNKDEEYTADDQADFLIALAKFRESQNDVLAAKGLYIEALKATPDNLEVLLAYARLLDRHSSIDEAVAVYQVATQKHPDSAKAWNDLGLGLARSGKMNESKNCLYRAIKIEGSNKKYRNNLATVLLELGRVDEALRELNEVHSEDVAHYNLAFMMQKKGDLRGAYDHFAQASKLNPQLAEATQWMEHLQSQISQQPSTSTPPAVASPGVSVPAWNETVEPPQWPPIAPLPGGSQVIPSQVEPPLPAASDSSHYQAQSIPGAARNSYPVGAPLPRAIQARRNLPSGYRQGQMPLARPVR